MELGSSFFFFFCFQICFPFIPTSLLLPAPLPHYLSALSHHCCDYGCHAVVKRSTINRPEIKPKNEFPQCRPHALLSRNYLAVEWLITPLRRQRQKRRRRDSLLTEAGGGGGRCKGTWRYLSKWVSGRPQTLGLDLKITSYSII